MSKLSEEVKATKKATEEKETVNKKLSEEIIIIKNQIDTLQKEKSILLLSFYSYY